MIIRENNRSPSHNKSPRKRKVNLVGGSIKADKNSFETFHAIKREVEELEAKKHGKEYWFKVT